MSDGSTAPEPGTTGPATTSEPGTTEPGATGSASTEPGVAEPTIAAEPLAGDALLAARDVVAGYIPGVNILDGTNLELLEGELVGIIGPNGAGKSTLVKALFGLLPIRSGQVVFRGREVTGLKAHDLVAQGIAYVPQVNNVFPRLTVVENLEMGTYLRPKRFRERFAVVGEMFPRLLERKGQRAGSLSGGERQMLSMARALMLDPEVLLLDEPSAGLSPAYQDEVFINCRRINEAGVSIVMVEQNAHRCLQICDRGYVLDQGRNAYTNSGDALLHDPKVIQLYLGSLAQVD